MKTCLMFFTVSWSGQTAQSEVESGNYNLWEQAAQAGMLPELTAAMRENTWAE